MEAFKKLKTGTQLALSIGTLKTSLLYAIAAMRESLSSIVGQVRQDQATSLAHVVDVFKLESHTASVTGLRGRKPRKAATPVTPAADDDVRRIANG